MSLEMIFIDLDDTILDVRTATRTAIQNYLISMSGTYPYVSLDEATIAWNRLASEQWQRYVSGEISFQEQRRERVKGFYASDFTDDEADREFDQYRILYENSWKVFPEAIRFLNHTKGLRKAIITNGDHDQQMRKVKSLSVDNHFECIITPSVTGFFKPHREMFLKSMAIFGLSPTQCCMIGDDYEIDIAPAKALGLGTFLVETGSSWLGILEEIKILAPFST